MSSVYCFLVVVVFLVNDARCVSPVKRSDDVMPLEIVVNTLSSRLATLEAKFSALSNNIDALNIKVAFETSLQGDVTFGKDVTVTFDRVQYNEGKGYNPVTGIFTAPVSGVYSFSMKTETSPGREAGLQMKKEGVLVLYIYGWDHDSYQTPSGEVVLHLDKGQHVWVVSTRTDSLLRSFTRFGGFLVQADI